MVTPLRDILKAAARAWGLEPAARLAVAQDVWARVVGRQLAEVSMPVALRGGRLRVGVRSPAAGQEIRLRRTAILRALNRELGAGAVTEIISSARRRLPTPGERERRPATR